MNDFIVEYAMNVRKVWAVSFSPTRTSKRIVDAIVSDISRHASDTLDFTYPDTFAAREFRPDELAVIGVPVYAGRVAPLAAERLGAMKGNNTPAVLVVLYGNRAYEDALIELKDLVERLSFVPVAAAAFVGEHSFSTAQMPIADGRPDSADLATAASFGRMVMEKIEKLPGTESLSALRFPGNFPYKDAMGPLPITPMVSAAKCSLCGVCIPTCPGGAITIDDGLVMDVDSCIFCCACIKNCPEEAISITAAPMLEKMNWLSKNCRERKEPELYI